MSRVLGRGPLFPFRPDVTGGFSLVGGEQVVAQSIQLLLATALEERQMRFALGSELPHMLFEPVNGATLARIEDAAPLDAGGAGAPDSRRERGCCGRPRGSSRRWF